MRQFGEGARHKTVQFRRERRDGRIKIGEM